MDKELTRLGKCKQIGRSIPVSSAKPTAKLMVETVLLRQTLASHAVLFLTAPREEGKLLVLKAKELGLPV